MRPTCGAGETSTVKVTKWMGHYGREPESQNGSCLVDGGTAEKLKVMRSRLTHVTQICGDV